MPPMSATVVLTASSPLPQRARAVLRGLILVFLSQPGCGSALEAAAEAQMELTGESDAYRDAVRGMPCKSDRDCSPKTVLGPLLACIEGRCGEPGQKAELATNQRPSDGGSSASRPSAAETIPDGCVKDTDCKGERICEAGECTRPARPEEKESVEAAGNQ